MRTAAPSLMISLAVALIASSHAHAEIAWQTNLRAAHTQAQSEGKLLLLHFYSDNCIYCEKLEKGAFQQPEVAEAISQQFVPVKVHADSSPKLAEMFKVTKFPTDVVVTIEGNTLLHSVSPQSAERYVAMLRASAASRSTVAAAEPAQIAATAPTPDVAVAANSPADGSGSSQPGAESHPVPGYATQATPYSVASTTQSPASNPATSESSVDTPVADAASSPAPTAGVSAQLASARSSAFEMPAMDLPGQPASESPAAETNPAVTSPTTTALPQNSASASLSDSPAAAGDLAVQLPSPGSSGSAAGATAGQPELAMQGFCPVTVIREDKWVEGKPEFGVVHLGKLYLFNSQEAMQTFLSDPIPYTPVLNEIDAVVFFEERRIVPGKREWGLKDPIYSRMFFFADEASMNHFYNQYERYTKAAIEVMDRAVKDANPGS